MRDVFDLALGFAVAAFAVIAMLIRRRPNEADGTVAEVIEMEDAPELFEDRAARAS